MKTLRVVGGGRPSSEGEHREPAEDVRTSAGFVGRDAELSELVGALGEMLGGRTQVRLIVGEAGIGKTRIAEEIARLADKDRVQVLWGRSHDDAGEPPFWPWAQAVRSYAARRSDAELRADIAGAPEVAEIAPVIRERLRDLAPVISPSSEQARFALFARFAAFLAAATARAPILLVLDDLHWADEASLRLLRFVAREPMSARLLVLATVREAEARRRPELQSVLADLDRLAARVTLDGLGEAEVEQLAELSLGRRIEPDLGRRVHRLSGGNPFFVGQVLRVLSRSGDAGTSLPNELSAHAGVRATVERRLDLLAPKTLRLLEVAAVASEEFDLEIVRVAGRLSRARALEVLEEAKADSLVVERSGTSRLAFAHALVREVLYRNLPVARRGRLHLAVARAIEVSRPAELDSHAASLLRHYEFAAASGAAASARTRAVDCALRAAEQANARCAFEDAAAYLSRAHALLADRAGSDATRAEILVRIGEARASGGDRAAARAAFSDAAELARGNGLWSHLARAALGFAGTWARIVLRTDPAVQALLEEALAAAPQRGAAALRSRLQARLAMELVSPTMTGRRLALADHAVAGARRARDDHALAFALTIRHLLFGEAEDIDLRLSAAHEVIDIARRNRSDELTADGLGFLVRNYLEAGRIAELDGALLEQTQLAERLRQPQVLWYVMLRRGMRALLAGRLGEAESLADGAMKLAERTQVTGPAFVIGLQRSMIRREQGRLVETEPGLLALIAAGLDLPQASFLLAWLHASSGRMDEAAGALENVARDGFAGVPSGVDRLAALTLAAETCRLLGDRRSAASVHALLLPHVGRNAILGNALAYVDCVSRPLGLTAMTLGEAVEAEGHFETALATYRKLGATARRAHVQADLAEALLARGDEARIRRALDLLADTARLAEEMALPGLLRRVEELARATPGHSPPRGEPSDATRPSHAFCREGEYWSVAFPGAARMRFRDAKGMRQIAALLARPGEEVTALDLVAAGDACDGPSETATRTRDPRETVVRSHLGDAGEVLDGRTRELYRRRVRDLREQVEDARVCNDPLRASEAEREIKTLADELARGFGLRGSRRAASHVERARVSTTRTLRDAIRRISEKHPQLGYHLGQTIRTGRLCSYNPPPGARIAWELG